MAPTLFNMNYFPIAILFSLLLLLKFVPSHGGATTSCTFANRTDDTYNHNLLNLFSNLTLSASTLPYKNFTAGDKAAAYGQYLCRGDTTTTLCHSCATNLTNSIISSITEDTDCWKGYGYMDQCVLHYANSSFFGTYSDEVIGSDYSDANVTNVEEFNRTLKGVFEELVSDAADSTALFATGDASVGGGRGKVYGLAQCTPDIGRANCTDCLTKASSKLQSCCGDKTRGWMLLVSCQLRFDNSTFYAVDVGPPGNSNHPADSNAQAVSGTFLLPTLAFFLFILLL